MNRWITRKEAGLREPTSPGSTSTGTSGVVVHYLGAGTWADSDPVELWRQVQGWHLNHPTENYRDIAYNLGVAPGMVLEGRSTLTRPNVRPGATGAANPTTFAVCALVGAGDGQPSRELIASVASAVAWLREQAGAADRITGHRDWMSTACPGALYEHLDEVRALADAPEQETPTVGREYADYVSKTNINIPRGKEVVLAELDARDFTGQALQFVAQMSFDPGSGITRAKRARVRFVRIPAMDGTGEGDYLVTSRIWRQVHTHTFMGGSKVQVRVTFRGRGLVRLRYGHFKAVRFG